LKTAFPANKIIILIALLSLFFCFSCVGKNQSGLSGGISDEQQKQDTTEQGDSSKNNPAAKLKSKKPVVSKGIDHYVRWKGETLSIIAKWYTGETDNWKALAALNPEINPHLLHMNIKIHIPYELIKNRKSMPKKFLIQFYTKKSTGNSTKDIINDNIESNNSTEPEENDNDIPLFGPKTYPAD